ncbi:alpha-N-acetylgalactosaminidase [Plutella xylostella]|uniref:alpha-N-acetylgalactosaminidase n=1 Tax=Plutella xylostella TaxID=51655 RepID=UPI002032362A|nr:alpha-N-acetylgalactosaminidase [Plutella xylostella]
MLLPWLVAALAASAAALNNGLALTPPMGWLTWERYRCITDCKKYPDECISEALIKRTADLMVSEGYLAAGYDYLGIDDCWLEKERGPDGRLVPDRERFPNGMKAVGDYIHSKGLKFGLYEDYGNLTCAGYPGVLGNEQLDIDTFVEWGVDYIKLDGCYVDEAQMDEGYPAYGKMLNQTGRPILYSCSWPAYQEDYNVKKKYIFTPDYESISRHCNLWRNWGDIDDSWSSMKEIMTWFGDNQDRFAHFAGPGNWNDPDMLLIGNFGLSVDQARVQMAVWSVLAAPLLMSTDLANMRDEFKEILLNKDIIAVNQDPMGKQGLRVFKNNQTKISVWNRQLHDGSNVLAFVSEREDGSPRSYSFSFSQMQLPQNSYRVQDLYHLEDDRILKSMEDFEVRINPTGCKYYKFTIIPSDESDEEQKTVENKI